MSNPGGTFTLADAQHDREPAVRCGSAARGAADLDREVSPAVAARRRTKMDVLRDLAPDLHDAILDVLAAHDSDHDCGEHTARGVALARLATTVHVASEGQGRRALYDRSREQPAPDAIRRRSLSESVRQEPAPDPIRGIGR